MSEPVSALDQKRAAINSLLLRRGRAIVEFVTACDRDAGYQVSMLLGDVALIMDVNDPSGLPVPIAYAPVAKDGEAGSSPHTVSVGEPIPTCDERRTESDSLSTLQSREQEVWELERRIEAIVYAYEGKPVPEDQRDKSFVKRAIRFRQSREQAQEPEQRCEGRYPVPPTSPPRQEPFEVTYRCGLNLGHAGEHGP